MSKFLLIFAFVAILVFGALFIFKSNFPNSDELSGESSELVIDPYLSPITSVPECMTGVAVPREEITPINSSKIAQGISEIKETLGINIIFQSFDTNSTQENWAAFFKEVQKENVKVLVALTDANYVPSCQSDTVCDLGLVKDFLTFYNENPEVFGDSLYGVLLIDEPLEDINAVQLKSLYSQAKEISPQVPLVVGWSRELWKASQNKKNKFEFTDGMCDVCLISALEFRDNGTGPIFDKETLIANQTVSRRVIKEADPDAKIITSLQVFGSPDGSYYFPTLEELTELTKIVMSEELQADGQLDAVMWQSWAAPTSNKSQRQLNLSDPTKSELQEFVKRLCSQVTT